MNGTGDQHVKWNQPDSEREKSHVFSYIQNLDFRKSRKETIWEVGGEQKEGGQEREWRDEYDQNMLHVCM
jgi:hypothetical protein